MQAVFTVYGGHVTAAGTATLSGAGLILGDACALLFILCLLTSGATWIMGADRALAVSCYDGAGPRVLGVINARYGTPVRVNVFSGIMATAVVVLAQQIISGDAAKYFNAVLGVTISTTLISYLFIYPALWKLRRSHPDTPRPFRMPAYRVLTVVLMVLVAIAAVQLIAPGLGSSWFGADFIPGELDVRPAVHLPVDGADPGAVVHRHRGGVLAAGQAHSGRSRPWPHSPRRDGGGLEHCGRGGAVSLRLRRWRPGR